jgi:exopolysaccharide production protein ExoZ
MFPDAPAKGRTVETIQVLRGFAATAVVFLHTTRAFTYRPPDLSWPAPVLLNSSYFYDFGSFGVDIFFVISGFIMVYVSKPYIEGHKPVSDFVVRRILRIYPLYLIAIALTWLTNLYFVKYRGWSGFDLSLQRMLDAVLFIPSLDEKRAVMPVVGVAWTLFYEMWFYLVFSIALMFFKRHVLPATTAILGAATLVAYWHGGTGAISLFLQNPMVFEFIFGCAVGQMYLGGHLPKWPLWVFFGPALGLMLVHLLFLEDKWRWLSVGVSSALIVVGCLALEARRVKSWGKWWMIFGDASYAIYLFHMIFLYKGLMILMDKVQFKFLSGLATDVAVAASIASLIATGLIISLTIERPIRYWTQAGLRCLSRSSPAPLGPQL